MKESVSTPALRNIAVVKLLVRFHVIKFTSQDAPIIHHPNNTTADPPAAILKSYTLYPSGSSRRALSSTRSGVTARQWGPNMLCFAVSPIVSLALRTVHCRDTYTVVRVP